MNKIVNATEIFAYFALTFVPLYIIIQFMR